MEEVKVFWMKQSFPDVDMTLEWLHKSEKEVFSGFKFPKKQNDWLLGRWTAKHAVKHFQRKHYPKLELSDIEIISASDGAPEVYHKGSPLGVLISLSHRHGMGFCVITSTGIQLGCDVEKIENRSALFVKDYFTEKEHAIVLDSLSDDQALCTNLIWSAKESTLKAIRIGLRMDTRALEVDFSTSLPLEQWNALNVTIPEKDLKFQGFWKRNSDFIMTIVADTPAFKPIEIKVSNLDF